MFTSPPSIFIQKTDHRRAQTLKQSHGSYALAKPVDKLPTKEEIDQQLAELSATMPHLTYKTTNPRVAATPPKVLPAHVVFDKKVRLCVLALWDLGVGGDWIERESASKE